MRKKITIVSLLFLIFIIGSISSYIVTSNKNSTDKQDVFEIQEKPNTTTTKINTESPDSNTKEPISTENIEVVNDNTTSESHYTVEVPTSSETSIPEIIETEPGEIDYSNEKKFTASGTIISPVFTHIEALNESEKLTTLSTGTKVTIIAEIYGWYKLDNNSYIYSSFVALD